jgi:drug/metabolite transporter (DMT)-like permease
MACTFFTLSRSALPLGDASTLFNLTPVFIAVLAPLVLRERAGRRATVALVLSLGGTLLVLRPSFIFGGAALPSAATMPAASAVVGALFSALAMLSLRRATGSEHVEAIATHFSVLATVVMVAVAIVVAPLPPLPALLPMVGAGTCAGLAQLAMTRAYALEPAARVSPVGYLQIVFTSLLGATLLAERPSATSVLGMGLVIVGGLFLAAVGIRDRRRR